MKVKRLILCLFSVALFSTQLPAQDWGVGLRLGDPTGISVKKYLGGSALELSFGRSHIYYGRGYYGRYFDDWYRDRNFPYADYQFIGYRRFTPVSMQLHYLIHRDLGNDLNTDLGGLEWYFGFGGQLRFQSYYYDFRYRLEGDPNWYYTEGARVTDIDLGVDGVIGLEYTFEEVPITLFLDFNLFLELVDNPFLFWGQGGLGVRYRF